jgi:hypothetical protein
MKKGAVILCTLSFLFAIKNTQLKAQATTKEITDPFFAVYAKYPMKAVDYAFATNKWMLKKPEEVTNVKTQLKTLTDLLGEYYGYDLISETTISPNLKVIKFLVKYDREPIKFTFLLYKPKDKWIVQNFSWNENLDKEIEDAPKAK